MSTASPSLLKQCPHCEAGFTNQKFLTNHVEIYGHHLLCTTCSRRFTSEGARNAHYRDSKQHPNCMHCNIGLENESALALHNAAVHPPSPSPHPFYQPAPKLPQFVPSSSQSTGYTHSCQTCKKDFLTKDALNEHQAAAHHEYYCDTCGRVFPSTAGKLLHFALTPACRRPTATGSQPDAAAGSIAESSSLGVASTSSAPEMVDTPSSDSVNSSLAGVVPFEPSAPKREDGLVSADPEVSSNKVEPIAEGLASLRTPSPSSSSPTNGDGVVQVMNPEPVRVPIVLGKVKVTPVITVPSPAAGFLTEPGSSPPDDRSPIYIPPVSTDSSRSVSRARTPIRTDDHNLARPASHASHRPRSVSSLTDDFEDVRPTHDRSTADRPVSWMSLGGFRTASRTSTRSYQARPAAPKVPAASTRNTTEPRGVQYVSHIYCRSCRRDPCVDVTATMCGHVFCNECITDAVIKTSRCPVCRAPTLLYSLFKLHLQ